MREKEVRRFNGSEVEEVQGWKKRFNGSMVQGLGGSGKIARRKAK